MWKYKNIVIDDIKKMPKDAIGFVYEVTQKSTNKKYIGKKILYNKRTLPPLKGQKRKRRITKESDWKTYYGSNIDIKSLIKEGKQYDFKREILQFAFNKTQLTYYETKYQFLYEVLEKDEYFNSTILGKFYKGKIL